MIEDTVQGHDFEREYRIPDANGMWRWFYDRSIGRQVKEDQLLIEGIALDITERRRAEDQLRQSEDRFRRLAENAPDMIYRMSLPEGRYVYVSPASTNLTEYTPQELQESPLLIRKIIHPDWRQYLSARLLHAREEERTRIAREIHDELGQSLTGLRMDLSWSFGKIPRQEGPLLNKTKPMIGIVDDTIRTGVRGLPGAW